MKLTIERFFPVLLGLVFALFSVSCSSGGDDDEENNIPDIDVNDIKYDDVVKMVVGTWNPDGENGRKFVFRPDGNYFDSKMPNNKYKWRIEEKTGNHRWIIWLENASYWIEVIDVDHWKMYSYDGTIFFYFIRISYSYDDVDYDERFDNVIPEDIPISPYIDIYRGFNPPNVEGVYSVKPLTTVHCEDYGNGGFAPGTQVNPIVIRLHGQDKSNNTINYEHYTENSDSYSKGDGAFISGYGNYFTVFFNTIGESHGIQTKTALVISGEKSSNGIKNLRYAFVMVEKGSDPSNLLMREGVFRVFKDGDYISEPCSWLYNR